MVKRDLSIAGKLRKAMKTDKKEQCYNYKQCLEFHNGRKQAINCKICNMRRPKRKKNEMDCS
jgi:hypothetical protein